jgi:hypothetical protein
MIGHCIYGFPLPSLISNFCVLQYLLLLLEKKDEQVPLQKLLADLESQLSWRLADVESRENRLEKGTRCFYLSFFFLSVIMCYRLPLFQCSH